MQESQNYWRKCANCKKEIKFGNIYQKCSVTTCKKHVYCSVDCWDIHVPILNHKSAWAEEERAPMYAETERPAKRIIVSNNSAKSSSTSSKNIPLDVLIVVSKLKNYVKEKHDMNTSGNVVEELSHVVREYADRACARARSEGRKTLMGKDF
jgi:histone H3/H4